jgi:hypothetical protein
MLMRTKKLNETLDTRQYLHNGSHEASITKILDAS